jgi:hypothetical protein
MKNKMKTTAQLILAAVLFFAACKKKEETNETTNNSTSTTTTTTGSPVVLRTMTASVNNTNWQAITNGYSFASTNTNYTFGGQTNVSPNPNTAISFNLPRPISVGVYTFSPTGVIKAYFRDSSGVFYTSNLGSINITQVDTTTPVNGTMTKLKATFNFTTSAVSSKSYTVNNGVIDYTK